MSTTRVTRSTSVRKAPSPKDSIDENVEGKRRAGKAKSAVRTPKSPPSPNENVNAAEVSPTTPPFTRDRIGLAKKALHTSIPHVLPCRESEIKFIHRFLTDHILDKKGGSLYISGSPGTGKTVVVHHVLDKIQTEIGNGKSLPFVPLFINCMNLGSPSIIFELIGTQLHLKSKGSELKEKLNARFTSKTGRMILLVLDEMDQLLTARGNDFLYKMFEMTQLPGSKLILVGVANSLDLTTRHLPQLATTSSPNAAPRRGSSGVERRDAPPVELLHFTPYEREEIAQILETRLAAVGDVFDSLALRLVATKVASSTGDMRKALNACKTALEQMEKQERIVLKTTADDGFNSSSPKKRRLDLIGEQIGIVSISKVLGPEKDEGTLPVQQLLLLATLLRLHRKATNMSNGDPNVTVTPAPIPLPSIYEEYQRICDKKGYEFIDMSEIVSVFGMLENRSLVSFAPSPCTTPSSRKGKMSSGRGKAMNGLTFDAKKLEFLLQKADFLNSIVYS